jgi:hypothetical protein
VDRALEGPLVHQFDNPIGKAVGAAGCSLAGSETLVGPLHPHDTGICGFPVITVARGDDNLARMSLGAVVAGGEE